MRASITLVSNRLIYCPDSSFKASPPQMTLSELLVMIPKKIGVPAGTGISFITVPPATDDQFSNEHNNTLR